LIHKHFVSFFLTNFFCSIPNKEFFIRNNKKNITQINYISMFTHRFLVRTGMLMLLILLIHGSKDLKRKRDGNQHEIKNENNQDLVDLIGAFIKRNIQRTEMVSSILRTGPVAAEMIYHQATINLVLEQFQRTGYLQRTIIQSEYLRHLPYDHITQNLRGAVTQASDNQWTLVTNARPPYRYNDRQLTLALNPAVTELMVLFDPGCQLAADHVKWKPRRGTVASLTVMSIIYSDPLHTINLRHISFIETLTIKALQVPRVTTTIAFPTMTTTVYVVFPVTEHPTPAGIILQDTDTTVTELTVRGATMTNGSSLPAIDSLQLHYVHHLDKVRWPSIPVDWIAVTGGSWAAGRLALATVPAVERLEFAELGAVSPADLRRVDFPSTVGGLYLGRGADRLAKFLDPTRFARSTVVRDIVVEVTEGERFMYQNEFYANLCLALLGEHRGQDIMTNCRDRVHYLVTDSYVEMMIAESGHRDPLPYSWVTINVAELIEHSMSPITIEDGEEEIASVHIQYE